MKPYDQILTNIARKHLGIETLVTRRSDSLDFHSVAIWQVHAALSAAFDAGAAAPTASLLEACQMVVDRWEEGDLAEAARACDAAIDEMAAATPPTGTDPGKKPHSVLLLYPDYANDGGAETYYAWVEASGPIAAIAEARRQAMATNEWTEEDVNPDDFVALLVIEGHHRGEPVFSR
jgi:hypothetical protein